MTVWILTRAVEYANSDRLCVWLNRPTGPELSRAVREAGYGTVLTCGRADALLEKGSVHLVGDEWIELDEEEVIQNG